MKLVISFSVSILWGIIDGKGKVTKHFVIKGIRKLLTYHLVDQFFKENNVSQEKQNELSDAVEIVL